jgi:hypothetical protein
MAAQNPAGPTAYPVPEALPDGSGLVSTEDGTPVLGPVLQATGTTVPNVIAGNTNQGVPGGSGVPPLNAILIELRVLNNLLAWQMGAEAPDLDAMRSSEAFDISLATGVLNGTVIPS